MAIVLAGAGCAEGDDDPMPGSPGLAAAALAPEWRKLDHRAGMGYNHFEGGSKPVRWTMQVSPPIPARWPPVAGAGATYYAYGEFQELFPHGPAQSRSAPWARVTLRPGAAPAIEILRPTIGTAVGREMSRPISQEQARRLVEIRALGEAALPDLLAWTALPEAGAPGIKPVRDFYCQWQHDNAVARFVAPLHPAFFAWLGCPKLLPQDNGVIP
jgi:hypothetical protein